MTDLPAPLELEELRRLLAAVKGVPGTADRINSLAALGAAAHDALPALLALAEEVERAKELVTDLEPVPLAERQGSEWRPTHRHYKGGLYRELMRGRIEADLTPCVIYDNAKGETWVRPAEEFDGAVDYDPKPVMRFTRLPEPPK